MHPQTFTRRIPIPQFGIALLLAGSLGAQGQAILNEGHADVGIDYDDTANTWNLHVHDEEHDQEYAPPSLAVHYVKNLAHGTVPTGAQWSFLGTAGSDLWTLPNVQNPDLLFLGFGAEELTTNTFLGDQFRMTLKSVTGPGSFTVYDTDAFGSPVALLNTRDGITGVDFVTLAAGAHRHANWAFSAPGEYSVVFEASATRFADSLPTSSGDVAYSFRVEAVPEPNAWLLGALGMMAILIFRRQPRRRT